MTMVSDNLASLFGGGTPGVRFRQGTILTWNNETGENTVDLAGGTLTNVPIINTGEAIALKAGHVVGMLGQGRTWFIIGRITPPNDPNFAGASVAFGGEGKSATNFSVTTTHADKVSGSIAVPSWVDEAIVLVTGNITVANESANNHVNAQVILDGAGGGGAGFSVATGNQQSCSPSAQRLITNPGSTITMSLQAWVDSGSIVADPATGAHIDAIAVFRSIA